MSDDERRLPFELTPLYWKSLSRIAGEAAEIWTMENIDCPHCGGELDDFKTNEPVKDFYCLDCGEEFQLKASKKYNSDDTSRITGSSFEAWRKAIKDDEQPNMLILTYSLKDSEISNYGRTIYANHFNRENTTVCLTGTRIFKKKGLVDNVYFIDRKHIDDDNLIERQKLGNNCRRSGWKGSYIEIDNSLAKTIYGKQYDELQSSTTID